jgi:hypothetical protein
MVTCLTLQSLVIQASIGCGMYKYLSVVRTTAGGVGVPLFIWKHQLEGETSDAYLPYCR